VARHSPLPVFSRQYAQWFSLRLCFGRRPAENARAVFAHKTVKREIEHQQHSEEHQDFDGPALRRILHQTGPSPLTLLSNSFGFFHLSQFARGQVNVERVAAIAATQSLAASPVVDKVEP
jgi:hypothetical protein